MLCVGWHKSRRSTLEWLRWPDPRPNHSSYYHPWGKWQPPFTSKFVRGLHYRKVHKAGYDDRARVRWLRSVVFGRVRSFDSLESRAHHRETYCSLNQTLYRAFLRGTRNHDGSLSPPELQGTSLEDHRGTLRLCSLTRERPSGTISFWNIVAEYQTTQSALSEQPKYTLRDSSGPNTGGQKSQTSNTQRQSWTHQEEGRMMFTQPSVNLPSINDNWRPITPEDIRGAGHTVTVSPGARELATR